MLFNAEKHGLNAALGSGGANPQCEEDKERVRRRVLRANPQREQFPPEHEEEGGQRCKYQECALNTHLDEVPQFGEVVASIQLAGKRIYDLSHAANAFRGKGQNLHGQSKEGHRHGR